MPLPRSRSTVVFRELPEGAILFCTSTETYFSLNPVGSMIWRLLPPVCATEAELVERLALDHPEVDPGTLAADVRHLIAELVAHDLVEVPQAA